MSDLKYKRVLLKVSGEALGEKTSQGDGYGLDFKKIDKVASAIGECVRMGVQVGLVIGGGNFWRGVKNGSGKMQRSHADSMGMLATVMNAIAVADVLQIPVKFVGVGEKAEDLMPFEAKDFVEALL